MGMRGGPILFVAKTSVPVGTKTYLTDHKASIMKGYVLGSTAQVSETVRRSLFNLIK